MAEPLQIIFDEDCGVCQATVAFLRKRDRDARFQFIGNKAAELPAGIDRAATDESVFVVEGERVRSRASAVGKVLRALPGPRSLGWNTLGALLLVPGLKQLGDVGYRLFARHRHQVSSALGMNACAVEPRRDPNT